MDQGSMIMSVDQVSITRALKRGPRIHCPRHCSLTYTHKCQCVKKRAESPRYNIFRHGQPQLVSKPSVVTARVIPAKSGYRRRKRAERPQPEKSSTSRTFIFWQRRALVTNMNVIQFVRFTRLFVREPRAGAARAHTAVS